MSQPLLLAESVSRNFGGLKALDQVSLHVSAGEILGLIGPNGAGKSTLFNCLAGSLPSSGGRIQFNGHEITRLGASRRARLGIARTFQLGKVFSTMTVKENVLAGLGIGAYGSFLRSVTGRVKGESELAQAREILDLFQLHDEAETLVATLPIGVQRRVESARAVATNPRLLLLDEPAAGLTHGEAESFAEIVRRVRARGITVVVIEHNMRFAMDLTDRLYVLVQGRIIAEGPPATVREDPDVVRAYLG